MKRLKNGFNYLNMVFGWINEKRETMQIEFTKQEKELLVQKLKHYFTNELDQDIGQFDAEFLLDFFGKELGVYYYNRGLIDAQLLMLFMSWKFLLSFRGSRIVF